MAAAEARQMESLRSKFGLPSAVEAMDDLILSAALAGIEQAQRWFSGLELSFEI
jgi:hypothetical protein